jgi:AraC family transcriptional regulator, transcriptional activator of pobA
MCIFAKNHTLMEQKLLGSFTVEDIRAQVPFLAKSIHLGNDIILLEGSNLDNIRSGSDSQSSSFFKYPCKIRAFVFILCKSGSMKIMVNLKEYNLTNGMILICHPNNIIQIDHNDFFEISGMIASSEFLDNVHIRFVNLASLFMRVNNMASLQLKRDEIMLLSKFFKLIRDIITGKESEHKVEIVKALGIAMFDKLCDIISEYSEVQLSGTVVQNRRSIIFEQFIKNISEYHCKERSVSFYAAKICVTTRYLSSVIKEISGKSAAEWIDEYVILEAKNLLKSSDMSIQEVAYTLNFNTQSFFGKYFKHLTGMSPKDYRQK